jgi:hypothetical protein
LHEQSNVPVIVRPQQANNVQQAMPFQVEDSVQNIKLDNLDGGSIVWDEDDGELVFDCQGSSPSPVHETAGMEASDIDNTLIEKFKDHCNRSTEQLPFSEEMKTRIELLHILKEAHAPHYLYQNIWKWAQSAVDRKVPFHDAGTQDCILNDLMSRYNLEETLPITTSENLPG